MSYLFIAVGIIGFALAIGAYAKASKLEAALKEKDILPKDWK